jgi:S1-C subfamily serine protease
MKKSFAGVIGLILLGSQSVLAAEQCGWPNSVALDSVVRVTSEDGSHASGVVVADDKVLTAAHAIDENFKSYVRINDHLRSARIVMIDRSKDLAILSVRTGDIRPIPLGMENLNASATVWAVGFPRAESKTTSSGSFKVKAENDGALHTTAPIDSGQSGGGLISCERGRHVLAGMLRGFAAYVNGDHYVKIKNHSVSVASADIRNFLTGWQNRSN